MKNQKFPWFDVCFKINRQKHLQDYWFPDLQILVFFFKTILEATWLHQFPPSIYSVYARQSTLRTINACESYINGLNTRVGRRVRPNFWVFVKILQNEENLAEDLTGDSNWATKLMFLKEKIGEA